MHTIPLRASRRDLSSAVAAALDSPIEPEVGAVLDDGIAWATRTWGDARKPPVLLVHGVTSDGATFWRIGPAIAAAGRRVIAVDLPGHGLTRTWRGRHRFRQTAEDLAGFIRTAGIDRTDLAVIGHSWGGMVVAALPAVGLRPRTLILLDPPAVPLEILAEMTRDPLERPYADIDEAVAAVRAAEPGWTPGDVRAKAEGLTRFVPAAVLAVLLENGDWDAGLAELPAASAAGVNTWLIRGEEATGSLVPDAFVPLLAAAIGPKRIITIAGGPHSPQRTQPEATVLAILRALGA